jgi:RNA polymerase sigma-70 factor (ECF subfamily)
MKITENDILACKKKQRKAQEIIYKNLYVSMVRVAFRYLHCMDLAQETYNTVMYKVFERMDQFQGSAQQFDPWIKRAIVNASLDYLKINQRRKLHETNAKQDSEGIEFDSSMEIHEYLMKALSRLPENQAQVFLLVAVDGYTHDEAAQILNISLSNSKYLLHNARKALQEMMTLKT